jgi:thiol-disulfide isomerase/thioredoxin
MNRKKGVLFLILLAGWVSGTRSDGAAAPAESQINPQAAKILRETFEKYQKCKTYQDEATLTIVMMNKAEQNKKSFDAKLIFVRPNKMRFIWPSLNLVCDGSRCQAVYPDFKQYLSQICPPVITQSFMKDALMEDYLTFALNGLVSEKPYETIVSTMQRLDYQGTVEKDGKKFYRINYIEGADSVDVLIDARTLLLDQINISPKKAKSRKWELQMVYKKIVLDAPVSASEFRIPEPRDVRKVDRISFTRQYDYPKVGQLVPETSLDIFGTNLKGSVGKLRGPKLTFVTFWATWCPPCRGELPELEKLYREYKSKGFQVIGINLDQEGAEDEIKKIVTDMKLTFPLLLDTGSKVAQDMLVQSIPTLLVLDREGKILEAHVGTSPNSAREFKGIIEKAVKVYSPSNTIK